MSNLLHAYPYVFGIWAAVGFLSWAGVVFEDGYLDFNKIFIFPFVILLGPIPYLWKPYSKRTVLDWRKWRRLPESIQELWNFSNRLSSESCSTKCDVEKLRARVSDLEKDMADIEDHLSKHTGPVRKEVKP